MSHPQERYRIGFIIEQALGHITHSKNLQVNVAIDPSIEAFWGLVPWEVNGVAARVPVFKSNWTVRAGLRARRAVAGIARHQPHALFFHTQVPAVLNTGWLQHIPSVISIDATPRQYDQLGAVYAHASGPEWLEKLKWRLNRDCFRAARHIIAWSEWARQGVVSEYEVPPEKVTVIPPGVNPSEWARPQPHSIHEGPVKILFVGGDFERKGGRLLLDAFRAVRPLGAELHLVTRFPVPSEAGVFVYNNLQPNSPQLRRLYHQSDVFCLPTYGDCLPMVLSEAGAAGLPTISTNVAGIPEIIQEGKTGLMIPIGDTAALATALRMMLEHPVLRLELGRRAVELVTARFDAQQNTQQLLEILKQTITTGKAQERAET